MDMNYGLEKLGSAVRRLVGKGTIKERLREAYLFNVMQLVGRDYLPEDLKQKLQEITYHLTEEKGEGEGAITATINEMSEADAVLYAEKICDLYFAATRKRDK